MNAIPDYRSAAPWLTMTGKISCFGGPEDAGVKPDEGVALVTPAIFPAYKKLFLADQPPGTTGLARRLDPRAFYCAMRWEYIITPKALLRASWVKITNAATQMVAHGIPVDWGPHSATGRLIDVSPGLMRALQAKTDDTVIVTLQVPHEYGARN